ncbi:reverse transcriptase domain-containing protein [Tanacetum coccineum]
MEKEDEEKTVFYTDQGTYCYTKIPFGLKNAGATYQRLIDSAFQSQTRRNLEAYVNDMVIKSKDEKMLLADIAETFDNLKKINMKLNPKKSSFGEMQSLSGKLAALNHFLAKSAERSLLFFNTFKNITKENKHEFWWTDKAEEAFQQMKKLILDLPSLTSPFPKETLYVYLAILYRVDDGDFMRFELFEEWTQVPRTKTYQVESDQKDKMRHAMDDNGIPSKEIHERHREHAITTKEAPDDPKPLQNVP